LSRPIELPEPWRSLAESAGGVAALAELCHTTKVSVWRWANGREQPPAAARVVLSELARSNGLSCPVAAPSEAEVAEALERLRIVDRRTRGQIRALERAKRGV
jgi:hypothetical protein